MSSPSYECLARAALRRPIAALVCAVAVTWLVQAPAAVGDTATPSFASAAPVPAGGAANAQNALDTPPPSKSSASATLEQCATATAPQSERSATFAGEMTEIPGSVRMEMRIDLLERVPGERPYRTVSAPGLGVWRSSAPGVTIYTYIKQVTDLSAPAFYRGAVRFRWLNAKGRLIKAEELRTPRCEQPPAPTATGTPSSAPAGAGASDDPGGATTTPTA